MRIVQLFFGQSMGVHGRISPTAWKRFLAREVTPKFPDGFTVYDAYGQWSDPKRHVIAREPSKVVTIAVPADANVADKLAAISLRYRQEFRQQSVGLLVAYGCGAF